jgi:mannosyltransferase
MFRLPEQLHKYKYIFILSFITICGLVLRICGLTVHSLWLDELQSVVTCDPNNSFSSIREICTASYDPAPPTFYYLLNLWFKLFGYSDTSARLLPAIFGIVSIPLMYLLGKNLFDRRVGIYAALITAINYYNISYSLEVRFYSLLFFFSALSYLYYFKLITKENNREAESSFTSRYRTAAAYVLSTVILTTLHYFALLIFVTQLLTWLVIKRKNILQVGQHLKTISAFLLIIIGFLPLIPHLLKTLSWEGSGQAFDGNHFFMIDYFNSFFGSNGIVVLSVLVCILVYLFQALQKNLPFKSNPGSSTPFVIFMWALLPLFIAYARTLFGSSALAQRYAIVILPALILMAAAGIECVKDFKLQAGLITLFVAGSILKLFAISPFYNGNIKDDFKGVAEKIDSTTARHKFSIYSDRNWHLRYYFNQFDLQPHLIDVADVTDLRFATGTMSTADSIQRDSLVKDIWIASAHFSNLEKMKNISALFRSGGSFMKIDSFMGKDAFADHYIRKDWREGVWLYEKLIGLSLFPGKMNVTGKQLLRENNIDVMAMWDGMVQSEKISLKKGDYKLRITSRGTTVRDTFPELEVGIDGNKLGTYICTKDYQEKIIDLRIPSDTTVSIYFKILNDFYDPVSGEDRNVFIKKVIVK